MCPIKGFTYKKYMVRYMNPFSFKHWTVWKSIQLTKHGCKQWKGFPKIGNKVRIGWLQDIFSWIFHPRFYPFLKVKLGHGLIEKFITQKMSRRSKCKSLSENIRIERGHWATSIVIEGTLRACMVQFPLNCISVGHSRRSRNNAVEWGTPNFCVCRLVMGNCGKIFIVENGVHPLPVKVKGFRHTPTGISEYTNVGIFSLFFLQISFWPSVSKHHGSNLWLKFNNHA